MTFGQQQQSSFSGCFVYRYRKSKGHDLSNLRSPMTTQCSVFKTASIRCSRNHFFFCYCCLFSSPFSPLSFSQRSYLECHHRNILITAPGFFATQKGRPRNTNLFRSSLSWTLLRSLVASSDTVNKSWACWLSLHSVSTWRATKCAWNWKQKNNIIFVW